MAVWVQDWLGLKESRWQNSCQCSLLWAGECEVKNRKKTKPRPPNINYFKVQLSTTHDSSFMIPPTISLSTPPQQTAEKILAIIEHEESKYQNSLSDAYQEMSEKTFKSLRRALPLTRQKLDWDKVYHFSIHNNIWINRKFSFLGALI